MDDNEEVRSKSSTGSARCSPEPSDPEELPEAVEVSAEVKERWARDMGILSEGVGLLFANRLEEACQLLEDAESRISGANADFAKGEHDLRGCFRFLGALLGLIKGLATFEHSQLVEMQNGMWAADELLCCDNDWAGRTELRGLVLVVIGLSEVMQNKFVAGVWHVLRAWTYLRYLESDGLNYQGHERDVVRSTALLGLGVFNVIVSLLPNRTKAVATWFAGFQSGQDVAIDQLRACWDEGGIQAPFAGIAIVAIAVDVSSFLGELNKDRRPLLDAARSILDKALLTYPDSFVFGCLQAAYLANDRDLPAAVAQLQESRSKASHIPLCSFLVHSRAATFLACDLRWSDAAASWRAALGVRQARGRRAVCPTLALNAFLCHMAAGDDEAAEEMLTTCLSYITEEKEWSPFDLDSLRQARSFAAVRRGAEGGDAANAATADQAEAAEEDTQLQPKPADDARWDLGQVLRVRPQMLLYQKICLLYRGVNFMDSSRSAEFLRLVEEETAMASEDANCRCMGLCIQAEAMRQQENWDDALRFALEGISLASELSEAGLASGSLQFCQLVVAYAYLGKGNREAARLAVQRLETLQSEHAFRKQVEFKGAHLSKLLGVETDTTEDDGYFDIEVGAGQTASLLVDVPEGIGQTQWCCLLQDYTVDFVASFRRTSPDDAVNGDGTHEVQRVSQHEASMGPISGELRKTGPGVLELVFDNKFSYFRSKYIRCRVDPVGLHVRRADC
eukprot:TRINITY_DN22273_c0_g1_i1.p1 TRINITY_DN22273_c0_g1~~TRINITY_DN22273_c0_g1_i1.p1  ORF type:complete len:736 (-),score=151.73 TRINITY_DN22273_c0_g1_i1:144-2351(-)